MMINSISAAVRGNTAFCGLWGPLKYSYSDTVHNGKYICDYYEKSYFPCKDESEEEIDSIMKAKAKEMNHDTFSDCENYGMGSYIYPVLGENLPVSKKELKSILALNAKYQN